MARAASQPTEKQVRELAHEHGLRLLRNSRFAGAYVSGPKYRLWDYDQVCAVWVGNSLAGALAFLERR